MKKKINVMHLVGTMSLGGSSKLVKFDVENQSKDRYNMSVCCLGALGEYGEELLNKGYSVESLGIRNSWKSIIRNIFGLIKLLFFLRKKDIDVINSHLFICGIIGRVFGYLLNINGIIHTTHNIMYPRIEPFIDKMLQRISNAIIVDSSAVKNKLINAGQSPNNINIIYNGVDESELKIDQEVIDIRKRLGLSKDDIIIGNISNFQYYKGHDCLIEIFSKLAMKFDNIFLLLVGEGELENNLKSLAKKLNIQDKIYFLGKRKNIYPIIQSMDIMVHPSRWEGFGIILVEAMLCKVPVIASNRGGIPEVVKDKVTGFLFPFGDVDSFVNSISLLINDKKLMYDLKIKGYKRAKEKFNIEKMILKYSKIYENISKSKK